MKVSIHTPMWPHQRAALKFMMTHDVGALFTKMGSGKSKVVIDLIQNKKWDKVLILCPIQVGANWKNQISIHQPKLQSLVLETCGMSVSKKSTLLSKNTGGVIFVCNYESIWREPLRDKILNTEWDAVICDESHRIKAPGSKVSRFLALLGKRVDNKYILTGTPLGNSPLDIYGQYRFIDPSIFGTNFGSFMSKYAYTRTLDTGVAVVDTKRKNPYKNLDDLKEKMYSIAFNVNVDQDLPEVQHVDVCYNIPPKTLEIYNKIRNDGVIMLKDKFVQAKNVLGVMITLQEVASGFVGTKSLDDPRKQQITEIDNNRLKTLENLLLGLDPDEPIVIFTKFRHDVSSISKLLDSIGRTHAELSGSANELSKWQEGKAAVLVSNIVSGSDGIDLTRAHYCVYYNHSWSLTNYHQSLKRLHRPGQRHQVIYYYIKLTLPGNQRSMDEIILGALKRNKDILQAIIEDGL